MSHYHILTKSIDNKTVNIAVHLPILAGENTAGQALGGESVTYQDAIKATLPQDADGTPVPTRVPDLLTKNPPEHAELLSGAKKEVSLNFRFSSIDLTNLERRTEIENGNANKDMIGVVQMVTDIAIPGTDLWNKVLEPLEWWGYHRDI